MNKFFFLINSNTFLELELKMKTENMKTNFYIHINDNGIMT